MVASSRCSQIDHSNGGIVNHVHSSYAMALKRITVNTMKRSSRRWHQLGEMVSCEPGVGCLRAFAPFEGGGGGQEK